MSDRQFGVRPLAGIHNFVRFGQRTAERLFHVHVNPPLGGRHRHVAAAIDPTGGNDQNVKLYLVQHFAVVPKGLLDSQFFRRLLKALRVVIRHGHDLRVGDPAECLVQRVPVASSARTAHDCHAICPVHGFFSLGLLPNKNAPLTRWCRPDHARRDEDGCGYAGSAGAIIMRFPSAAHARSCSAWLCRNRSFGRIHVSRWPCSEGESMPVPQATAGRRRRGKSLPQQAADTDHPRLQKVLAAAGIASRRECEELIREGRVEVDRQVVTRLGTKVDLASQEIRVDGELLPTARRAYYLVNKPKGFVSTSRDPAGRARVVDLVPPEAGRLFAVGRLDRDSEGLMLLTNDGGLANRLAHPRFGVEKRYEVQVAGYPEPAVLRKLRQGIVLAEGVVRAESVRIKRRHKQSTVLEIVLKEGKNREIRRMLAASGHKVQRLKRVALGSLRLGQLPVGEYRRLTRDELKKLRAAAEQGRSALNRRAGRRRGTPPSGRREAR